MRLAKQEPTIRERPHQSPIVRRTTMRAGVIVTEAVETVDSPDDGAGAVVPAAMSPAASEQWNAWLSGHIDLAIADLIEATGKEFNHVRGEVEDALLVHAKRI